jgi:hypothetical protein
MREDESVDVKALDHEREHTRMNIRTDQDGALSSSSPGSVSAEDVPSNVGKWEFADVGYDTAKGLWFLQLFNDANEDVGILHAKSIELVNGTAIQQQWKDGRGKRFWHVRERLFASEPANFSIDNGGNLEVRFETLAKADKTALDHRDRPEEGIPEGFSYLLYAYHLRSNEGKEAPRGFVEFFDSNERRIATLENRWIIVEDVSRKTVGEPPSLRLRIERDSVARILLTSTVVVIMGREARPPTVHEF